MRKSYALEEIQRLSFKSPEHAQREREDYQQGRDEIISKCKLTINRTNLKCVYTHCIEPPDMGAPRCNNGT